MAHALPFVPFSQSAELPEREESRPEDGSSAELRRRAEAAKDRIYRRHVSQVLESHHALRWSTLDRDQKLSLVGQVAEKNARFELSKISAEANTPFRTHWDLVSEYLRRQGTPQVASTWQLLRDEDKDRTFFAAAVRRFLRSVTDEVLRELRTETWNRTGRVTKNATA